MVNTLQFVLSKQVVLEEIFSRTFPTFLIICYKGPIPTPIGSIIVHLVFYEEDLGLVYPSYVVGTDRPLSYIYPDNHLYLSNLLRCPVYFVDLLRPHPEWDQYRGRVSQVAYHLDHTCPVIPWSL